MLLSKHTKAAQHTNLLYCAKISTYFHRALRRKGGLVEVILPKYASLDMSVLDDLQEASRELYSYFDGEWHRNKVWTG